MKKKIIFYVLIFLLIFFTINIASFVLIQSVTKKNIYTKEYIEFNNYSRSIQKFNKNKGYAIAYNAIVGFKVNNYNKNTISNRNLANITNSEQAKGFLEKINEIANKHKSIITKFNDIYRKELCNIRMQNKHTGEIFVKPPKLTELYMKLFDVDAKNLHDSFIDVIVCLRCYAVLCENIRNDIYNDCFRLKELLDEHVN